MVSEGTMHVTTPELSPTDSASAQLIGLMLDWGLFGFLIAQVFTYHTSFPNDQVLNKSLVHVIFVLEIAQTALLTHDRYITFVSTFGDPLGPETIRTSWFSIPILCGVIGFISQVFYAHRIYNISRSKMLGAVVLVLSTVQLISSIAEGALACKAKYFFELGTREFMIVTAFWLLSTVICDVMIAISMIYFLLVFRRDFHPTSFDFSKIISLTIETGLVTAIAALLTGILFIVRRKMLNGRVKVGNGYSEPFSTTKPEIAAVPLSHGPMSPQQTCSGVADDILEDESGHDQKSKEV